MDSHTARWLLAAALLWTLRAEAFSLGSPVCEVNALPLIPMSSTLSSPPPTGWFVAPEDQVYFPGEDLTIRVANPDPSLLAKGVLLWAKFDPFRGAGAFVLPPGDRFQHVPPTSTVQCDEWAITHTDGDPKSQELLAFAWTPPPGGAVIVRAFVIEQCDAPPGGCRSSQALTPIIELLPGVFRNGFE